MIARPTSLEALLAENGIIPVADGVRMGDGNRLSEEIREEQARRARREMEARTPITTPRGRSSPPSADGSSQIFCADNPAACLGALPTPSRPGTLTPGTVGPGGNANSGAGGIFGR